jgi:multidrug efflux pump subunit AcrA (membrane-fusion protein)
MPLSNNNRTSDIIHQDELQEMLGHPPGWILHVGISLIGFAILIALVLSWLIRYPDELSAKMTIVQTIPPHEIRSFKAGRLDTILYANGDFIQKGDRVIIVEDAAKWRDVDTIYHLLQRKDKPLVKWPQQLVLGNLQRDYATFLDACNEWRFFRSQMIFLERQEALKEEITSLERLAQIYEQQKLYFVAEKQLIDINQSRIKELYEDSVSSKVELEEHQRQVLQYDQQLTTLEVTILQNRMRKQQLMAQLMENDYEGLKSEHDLLLHYDQARRQLLGGIEQWYDQHILTSPISGRLEWSKQLASQHPIQSGELLALIIPASHQEAAYAQLNLPATGLAKIALGAPVKISLDAYPEQEFGQISGRVNEINYAPVEYNEATPEYRLKVLLPDPLVTTYGKEITVRPNMPGKASVITQDRRILERVMQQLIDVFKNS